MIISYWYNSLGISSETLGRLSTRKKNHYVSQSDDTVLAPVLAFLYICEKNMVKIYGNYL